MNIFITNTSKIKNGGGFTFVRNLKKGLTGKVNFVNTVDECDIILCFGVSTIDKDKVYYALSQGKKFVLRVDNVPRKSRNLRSSPADFYFF